MPDETSPGAVVRAAREALGWTVYRLAKEAGVDQSQLLRIERGDQGMSLETARKLARALGVSLAVFDAPAQP